jgi:mRNA interferase MazF
VFVRVSRETVFYSSSLAALSSQVTTNHLLGKQRAGSAKRGEIRWYTFALPDKRRPVLILSRNEVIDHLNEIIVVPVTRTIRGLATEVVLTPDDGMPLVSALNFDHVALAQRPRIGNVICSLPPERWAEVQGALMTLSRQGFEP